MRWPQIVDTLSDRNRLCWVMLVIPSVLYVDIMVCDWPRGGDGLFSDSLCAVRGYNGV